LAAAVASLGLRYAVVTSVTRDDLEDGGAGWFARCVAEIRRASPGTSVELLIPDFGGNPEALESVLEAGPDVVGHNLETVRRLTPRIRDARADFDRSLGVLAFLGHRHGAVKTSLLVGLGETPGEVCECLEDARRAGTAHLAVGQYLAPSPRHAPVVRYWSPAEFDALSDRARQMGFATVAAGPLVRSSYKAEEFAGRTVRRPTR